MSPLFSLLIGNHSVLECTQLSSIQLLSHVQLFETPWNAARQASLSSPTCLLKLMSIQFVMPSNHFIICHHLLLLPSVFPSIRVLSNESGGQSIGVSALVSALPMNIQDWFPLGWTGWIFLQSKDSQESSPTPQFKIINSSALSLLHSPTLTSIHDHRKNHSLD